MQVERWERAPRLNPLNGRPLPVCMRWAPSLLWSWQYGFILFPLALVSIARTGVEPDIWFLGAMLFLLALFWLGFTHLQSRFLILIVPICALLIARLPWFIGIAIAAQALSHSSHCIWNLNHTCNQFGEVFAATDRHGVASMDGAAAWCRTMFPPDAMLILVGDGKAFCYQRPMSHLRYRTIFDADTSNGRGIIEAWAGSDTSPAWLLIDPR